MVVARPDTHVLLVSRGTDRTWRTEVCVICWTAERKQLQTRTRTWVSVSLNIQQNF